MQKMRKRDKFAAVAIAILVMGYLALYFTGYLDKYKPLMKEMENYDRIKLPR